jgi:hypothetical protein
MKLVALFLCAVAALSIANMETADVANLDETTEMIHAHSEIHATAKVHAKVSSDSKLGDKVASKVASKVAARATVMIGTHEVDSEAVSMAKAQLHKLVTKIGARHPEFLGETASVSSLVQEGTTSGYVAGGYLRLRRILTKIDQFEMELDDEHKALDKKRNAEIKRCRNEKRRLQKGVRRFLRTRYRVKRKMKRKERRIGHKMAQIERSMRSEAGPVMEQEMSKVIVNTKHSYSSYWQQTEERHQVRNVLMQALWLVCVGFRKFRHTSYCTTLRKQPDYKESGDNKWRHEAGNDYQANKMNSMKFADTMTPIWEQQKVADSEAANRLDGDADMEKGFQNNRAPWGVDPVASGGEKKEELTSEQMSSRLSFLIQTSFTPERIATPITSFISALQEGDEATQQSLVKALVNIDREEGEAQSTLDAEWYADMVANWRTQYHITSSQYKERRLQGHLHNQITKIHASMAAATQDLETLTSVQEGAVKEGRITSAKCAMDLIDIEATLEVNEEELVNIMRLNSLLRFLVIGEKAECSDCKDDNRGSCTWVTRGAEAVGADADQTNTNCKNLQGESVTCNYADSEYDRTIPNDYKGSRKSGPSVTHYAHRSAVFCACEYGYYGGRESTSPMGIPMSQDCPYMKCPGYGRILYPALAGDGKGTALAVSGAPARAVCSAKWGRTHGECDRTRGLCLRCFRRWKANGAHSWTPDNIETAIMHKSYPYHGNSRKCEHWMCPTGPTKPGGRKFLYRPGINGNVCSRHGHCHQNDYKQYTGRCVCRDNWYGRACHLHKCQARKGVWFKAGNPAACNGKGECLAVQGKAGLALGACRCSDRFHGEFCHLKRCPGYSKRLIAQGKPDSSCPGGTCDANSGACNCNGGGTACGREKEEQCPAGCSFRSCTKKCSKHGRCDRISGMCVCNRDMLLNGPTCKRPKRCDHKSSDWSLTMDKWGWSTCKHGYLLVGLKTDRQGTADALYNLDTAVCAKPCEGDQREDINVDRYACYHENWWKKFDTAGGKYCRRNYFVAGLFRSHCNSLYCIEMAKCCQVRKSLWTACKWSSATGWTQTNGGLMADNHDGFVVGFWRTGLHTLNGLTQLRICTPVWWGVFDPDAER